MKTSIALAAAAFALMPLAASSQALRFDVQDHGMSRVSFTSEAPLETIVGTTTVVTGELAVDLKSPGKTATGTVNVDIAAIRTGVDLRDEHLRSENWLDAAKFPKATFALEHLAAPGALVAGKTLTGTASGTLTIHGVTKKVSVPVTIGFHKWTEELKNFGIATDLLRVKATFVVKLADYGIKIPSMLGRKLGETVEIAVNLTAVQKP